MEKMTAAFIMRPPVKEDAAAILEYLKVIGSETDNLTFGEEGHPNTIAQEEAFILSLTKENNQLMLLGLVGTEIMAIGSLSGSRRERLRHSMELGISVKRAYWNMGVGSAIINELINEARKLGHVVQITLHVVARNTRAIHLYHKLGFVDHGVFPKQIKVGDAYLDSLFMTFDL